MAYLKFRIERNSDSMLIDVRTAQEHLTKTIPGAINIPVDELRERLQEIPKEKTLYVFCEIGLRGYLAQRILRQHGYSEVYNLSGGFALWNVATMETELGKKLEHLAN